MVNYCLHDSLILWTYFADVSWFAKWSLIWLRSSVSPIPIPILLALSVTPLVWKLSILLLIICLFLMFMVIFCCFIFCHYHLAICSILLWNCVFLLGLFLLLAKATWSKCFHFVLWMGLEWHSYFSLFSPRRNLHGFCSALFLHWWNHMAFIIFISQVVDGIGMTFVILFSLSL